MRGRGDGGGGGGASTMGTRLQMTNALKYTVKN